jgi:hypothetical protein
VKGGQNIYCTFICIIIEKKSFKVGLEEIHVTCGAVDSIAVLQEKAEFCSNERGNDR